MKIMKCTMCGSEKIKKGKIHGMAAVMPLNSRTGMFGSALIEQERTDRKQIIPNFRLF